MPTNQENYFRICLLVLEVITPLLQKFLDKCISETNQTLQVFIHNNQHKIYHMCFNSDCCKCVSQSNKVQNRPLSRKQYEVLFDCSKTQADHKYCCATVNPNILMEDLDISLINILLLNFFTDVFWDFLDHQNFESFLNSNKHAIFHMYIKTKCCCCEEGHRFSTTTTQPKAHTIGKLFKTNAPRCKECSKLTNKQITPCSMVAKTNISERSLKEYEISIFQQHFSSTRIKLDTIVDLRNTVFAHVTKACIPDAEYTSLKDQFVNASLWLYDQYGIEPSVESLIQEKLDQPFDIHLTQMYENKLREQQERNVDLEKVILDFNENIKKKQEDQDNTVKNLEEITLRAERSRNFYQFYQRSPSLFIQMLILTLSQADTSHLCDDGSKFKIKPARYPASKVFMSILREGWIRFSDSEEKYIEFLFQRANNANGGKQYYHIKSAAYPNYYLTMGFCGWWVRAKCYDDQPTEDAATWDIRCLKTDELSLYMLVPKNSEDFVCVDFTRRLKGSCGNIDDSKMFLFERT